MPGLPTQTGYASVDASGRIDVCMSRPRDSRDAISDVLRSRRPINMTFMKPTSRYASVSWLKAAYLSVFSLLGVHGYRYAEGEAIEPVRKQVMKPEDEVIRNFAVNAPAAWRERDGIAMNRKRRPCWAVKVGDCIVLLPRSWDQSYYEWTSSMSPPNEKITIGGGPRWNPAKFGSRRVASISFQEGHNPIKILYRPSSKKLGSDAATAASWPPPSAACAAAPPVVAAIEAVLELVARRVVRRAGMVGAPRSASRSLGSRSGRGSRSPACRRPSRVACARSPLPPAP